jgi:Cu(I)/Ag(I) efflux system membrane fusion protein
MDNMKKIIFATFIVVSLVFIVSCNRGTKNPHNKMETQSTNSEVYYTCTMHPEIHSDKPGNCPKCGMELVQKVVDKSDTTQIHQHNEGMQMY